MENSAPIVPEAPVRLWLPGLGVTDLRIRRVARAVKQYDESLELARHEVTGDWVVTKGESGFPVFGFGRELPNPDEVETILGRHDIKRHGKKMMDQLAREAELRRKEAEYRMEETDGVAAEAFEAAFRRMGRHPNPRIFVPRSI